MSPKAGGIGRWNWRFAHSEGFSFNSESLYGAVTFGEAFGEGFGWEQDVSHTCEIVWKHVNMQHVEVWRMICCAGADPQFPSLSDWDWRIGWYI